MSGTDKRRKLTDEQREEIRRRRSAGELLRVLAAEFDVSTDTIHRACNPAARVSAQAATRAWQARNRDRVRRYQAQYDRDHKEAIQEKNRRWYERAKAADPDAIRRRNVEAGRRFRERQRAASAQQAAE